MLYWTTPTDRHRRGWDKEMQKEEKKEEELRRRSSLYITETAEIEHR
jgi:hypothetical protein